MSAFLCIFLTTGAVLLVFLRKDRGKLEKKAKIDALTGILNKASFMSALNKTRKNEKEENFSFIFIDLDNFKNVNDKLGHSIGDV
ncbi:MAG: diguanylate cyclase, partial [Spirochaetales bacterium]|nr:diguanylate cyclase [Spirochaetales bacterium]